MLVDKLLIALLTADEDDEDCVEDIDCEGIDGDDDESGVDDDC